MNALSDAALKRADILHASAAWGTDGDATLMQLLVEQNAELVEALRRLAEAPHSGWTIAQAQARALLARIEGKSA